MAKLQEHEYVFCTALHEKLKEKVNGKVYTTVQDDVLKIEIHMGKIEFNMDIENFADKIYGGLTDNDVVAEVVGKYGSYIKHLYFK